MINTILPTPKKTEVFEGISTVDNAIWTEHAPFLESLDVFADAVKRIFSVDVSVAPGGIQVVYDPALADDAYTLDSRDGLVLAASAKEGLLYALATAIHAINVKDGRITCEKAFIEDHPEKPYRTLMVDLVREWIPAHRVLRYIDVCFMQKLNHLHLHLVDDQRFTLPSRAFPLLPTPNEHYTEEDIRSFCEYATARGITLVPELEIPGHAGFLTKSYPEYFANELMDGAETTIVTEEGLTINASSIVCAGKQATMDGIRTILQEICQLFPNSPYIHHKAGHVGGMRTYNGFCFRTKKGFKLSHVRNSSGISCYKINPYVFFLLQTVQRPQHRIMLQIRGYDMISRHKEPVQCNI